MQSKVFMYSLHAYTIQPINVQVYLLTQYKSEVYVRTVEKFRSVEVYLCTVEKCRSVQTYSGTYE